MVATFRKVALFLVAMSIAGIWFASLHQNNAIVRGIQSTFSTSIQNNTARTSVLYNTERGEGSSTRVLCLLLTTEKEVRKVEAVNKTWSRRCDKTLFIYGSAKESHLQGDKLFVKAPEGRGLLAGKVKAAFQFAHKHFNSSFDWFLKADVDTYVIMENLKLLLSTRDPMQSILLGRHFKQSPNKIGYMSGGGGYVLSARALRDLVVHAIGSAKCRTNTGSEDVRIAICLESVNVTIWSSLDTDRKETFHAEPLGNYLSPPIPEWLKAWSWNKARYGPDCCAKYSITFHHLTPRDMYLYEHLLYNTKVNTGPLRQDVFQNTEEMTRPKS